MVLDFTGLEFSADIHGLYNVVARTPWTPGSHHCSQDSDGWYDYLQVLCLYFLATAFTLWFFFFIYFFLSFVFFVVVLLLLLLLLFLGPLPRHMEVPRLGVQSEL